MFEINEMPIRRGRVTLRAAQGHFATNHCHMNYYIDISYNKTRLSEAKETAKELVSHFINNTPIDTILCLDDTAVIGTWVAEELTKTGFQTINAHKTVYVVTPELSGGNSMIILRDNVQQMIRGKHVLILMASCATGLTAKHAIEAITYYGGEVAGIAAIYRAVDEVEGYPVRSVYSISDLPDYGSWDYKNCPYCKKGVKLDALVNCHGYSSI